jgi:hypothetical protein
MHRHTLVLMLTLVTLAAPATALADDRTRVTRFTGSDTGTFTSTPRTPEIVFTEDVTSGWATGGIGRYTIVASELVNLTTFDVTDGAWTLTARKGTLEGTYAGKASIPSPGVITYSVRGRITGGTRRFKGARGRVRFDGRGSLETGKLSETMSGVLVLPPHH